MRKDKDAKVNMWNYFYEFDFLTWLGIGITSLLCMMALLSVLIMTRCSVDDESEKLNLYP